MTEPTKTREGDQPLPVGGKECVQDALIALIEERKQLGVQRYGSPLMSFNGRDSVRGAIEEALDLAVYLMQVDLEMRGLSSEVRDLRAQVSAQHARHTGQPGAPQPHESPDGAQPVPDPERAADGRTAPRRFHLVRHEDETGTSGVGTVVEGVQFTDGTIALRWLTDTTSTAVYASIEDVITIHGHGGKTTVAWLDLEPEQEAAFTALVQDGRQLTGDEGALRRELRAAIEPVLDDYPEHNTNSEPVVRHAIAAWHNAYDRADAAEAELASMEAHLRKIETLRDRALQRAEQAEAAVALVREWATSGVVTAQTEFGNGYREALRDIRDKLAALDQPATDAARSLMADYDEIDLAEELAAAQAERDGVYRERAQLLAWLATLVPAVLAPAPDVDEPGWLLLYLDSPAGQLSWHIAPRDVELFDHVEHVTPDDPRAQWDGHDTTEKYQRIRHLVVRHLIGGGQPPSDTGAR